MGEQAAGSRITDDDATIRAALDDVEVPALLAAVAHATGDLSILRDDLRPDATNVLLPHGGLDDARQAEARELACRALAELRRRGGEPATGASDAVLARIMAFLVGDDNVAAYDRVLREELALDGADLRAPAWHADDVARGTAFRVAIVGAGMSGLLAAHRLGQAGVPHVVFEKNDDVGGTWFENTYPGCRVDVPNNLYSYSFAQHDWPEHFSAQGELLGYFRRFADEAGVRRHVRFGTEVRSAVWDDDRAAWVVTTRGADDAEDQQVFQALVSAVGQLNQPSFPDIPGLDRFAGPAFHSARWDHDVPLAGRRVAVIGTGASAAQFIPAIAGEVGHLTVFQRTPNWLVPTPEYHDAIPPGMRWLNRHLPAFGQWYRLWLFWRMHEGLLPAAAVDPEWDGGGRSVSMVNELVRQLLEAYLQLEFAGEPELFEQVVPTYPPIAKRIIRDNGVWAATLRSDHVDLVTTGIAEIVPEGVVTTDGVLHEADVLVYGTGFKASEFLTPMTVVGRDGVDLHERWAGDARAYLGITVPGFPNLFCLYGPNTNIVINGSIIYFSECEVRYLLGCVRLLLEGGHRALDVRPDVHDAYNKLIDEANCAMAWGASSVHSWYKNQQGRVAQNWPYSLLEYWERTLEPDPGDYELL